MKAFTYLRTPVHQVTVKIRTIRIKLMQYLFRPYPKVPISELVKIAIV